MQEDEQGMLMKSIFPSQLKYIKNFLTFSQKETNLLNYTYLTAKYYQPKFVKMVVRL